MDSAISFADEMRVGLIGQVRRIWAPRGVKIVQEKEFVYEWDYLNLAVDGRTGTLYWAWTDDMKAPSLASVVNRWGTEGLDAVVWDGAPGHRGSAFDFVDVKRIRQPSYSPELNPAERVFEELRARIEGIVYGSLDAKKAAVETVLSELINDPVRVKRLTGWHWIRSSIECLSETETYS